MRQRKESLIIREKNLQTRKKNWTTTEAGKGLQRLKSKRTRVRKVLKDVRRLNDIVGNNQTSMAPAVADLLAELDQVINEDMPVDEPIVEGNPDDDSDADDDANSVSAEEPAETGNVEVQQKIDELQVKLKEVDNEIRVNEKVFTNFSQAIKKQATCLPRPGLKSVHPRLRGNAPVTASNPRYSAG